MTAQQIVVLINLELISGMDEEEGSIASGVPPFTPVKNINM